MIYKKYFSALVLLFLSSTSLADCDNSPINIISDISWQCMFPMTLAGVSMGGGEDSPNAVTSTICTCKNGPVPSMGIMYSLWEPSRMIDTVADPYCMVPLGTKIGSTSGAKLSGSLTRTAGSTRAFQQGHYYIFPVFQILDMFWDIPCIGDEGFDIAMMTEIVPTWNNEALALIIHPESVLFGNPVSEIACAADAALALKGFPRPELFWCMGSWGNAYPLSGSITSSDYLEANAALAARLTYFMGRTGLLLESSNDGCTKSNAVIWSKDKYKYQLAQPTKDSNCLPIGRDALLWGAGKHNLYKDNFMWLMFKKLNCCMTAY